MNRISHWLRKDGNIAKLNTVLSLIVSLAALIVSIANAIFVGQQTKINKMLYGVQMEQAQPYYIISTSLEMDSTDGVYGTEHLKIFNRGYTNVSSETSLITDDLVTDQNRIKFIPIIRRGTKETSYPRFLGSRNGADMTDDNKYLVVLEELKRNLIQY